MEGKGYMEGIDYCRQALNMFFGGCVLKAITIV